MRRLLPVLLILASVAGISASTLELRSRPAEDAAVLATIASDDPALAAAEVVPDGAAAALGWRRLHHRATYTGFVPRRSIGKNLEVAPGTPVRVAPDARADLLTIVALEDAIEVVDPQTWASVRITKQIPVFVRLPVRTEPAPAPAPRPEPAPPPAATPQPLAGVIYGPVDAATAVAGSSRILEGRLREVRSLPGFTTRFRFELLDRNGRRFAFVQLQDAVLAGTLTRYLDQTVTVYGRIDFDDKDLFVVARVVRLKEARTGNVR